MCTGVQSLRPSGSAPASKSNLAAYEKRILDGGGVGRAAAVAVAAAVAAAVGGDDVGGFCDLGAIVASESLGLGVELSADAW